MDQVLLNELIVATPAGLLDVCMAEPFHKVLAFSFIKPLILERQSHGLRAVGKCLDLRN